MTQSYYTATQGPEDKNAGFRAKLYAGLAALTGIIGLLQTFHVIDAGQASNIGLIAQGVGGLLGAGGLALAASKTSQQSKNGTFDPAPPPPPAQTAVEGIQAVAQQFNDLTQAVTAGVQRVQDVAGGLANAVGGGLGALLPGSLAAQVAAQAAQQANGGANLFGQGPAPTPASTIPAP